MLHIGAKRYELNDDSTTYLWHCRLSHVSINCMKRLHADGSLYSPDFESLSDMQIIPHEQGLVFIEMK